MCKYTKPGQPIRGYTGYPWGTFCGGMTVDQYGRQTFIGVFPQSRYGGSSDPGPYPGLR